MKNVIADFLAGCGLIGGIMLFAVIAYIFFKIFVILLIIFVVTLIGHMIRN